MKKSLKVAIAAAILATGFLSAQSDNEDQLIIKALYYEVNNPKMAAEVWKKLFVLTNNDEYLIEYFNAAIAYKDLKEVIDELKAILSKKHSKELYELLANLYIKDGNNNSAINMLENVKKLDIDSLYQLAYLYSLSGKDDKALEIYTKIYNKERTWESLKGKLSILAKNKKQDKIKEILWQAINENKNFPTEAYMVLAGLLDYKKDTQKAITVFKKLYEKTKDKEYLKQLISLYLYKNDYISLIPLLKETSYDNKLLFEIYVANKDMVDAYKLIDRLYKERKNPKYIAEKAILTYEIASKYEAVDNRVIKRASELFEKAFELGVKEKMYYNYYGYILIDSGYNVQKGVELVKVSLQKEPNNIFFLDSLAWGYYKLKEYKKAKEVVQKIQSLSKEITEDEILEHIEIIQKSKEK
jgi:tetratricopeptide (TPR) repeat protein